MKKLKRVGYEGATSVEYEAQVFGFSLSDAEILRNGRDFMSEFGID